MDIATDKDANDVISIQNAVLPVSLVIFSTLGPFLGVHKVIPYSLPCLSHFLDFFLFNDLFHNCWCFLSNSSLPPALFALQECSGQSCLCLQFPFPAVFVVIFKSL